MKKFLITAALLLAGATAAFAQFHLGAGYYGEYSTASWKDGDIKHRESGILNGFYLGGSYNIAFDGVEGLGIAPGAYFTFVGGHRWEGLEWGYNHRTAIDIPVHITYSHDLGPGAIFGYAGPAFNVGLGYKRSVKWYNDESGKYEKLTYNYYKIKHLEDEGVFHRFDCKLGLGVGYRWEHLAADFGWDFGLINQYRNEIRKAPGKNKAHIHSFHVGVAYVF